MAVICFASLKGGVGKTSLSVNVSHGFAKRGCRTLLIDCDPSGHATSFFRLVGTPLKNSVSRTAAATKGSEGSKFLGEAPLARMFLSKNPETLDTQDALSEEGVDTIFPVRSQLDLLPSGPELRHLLWGRGAKAFAALFPQLIQELRNDYDHIVIDTPPDFNVLTRNAIACADIVGVPVDPSEMSINSLEEIMANAQHIKGPTWVIARSMVNRQARRVNRLGAERLDKNLHVCNADIDTDDSIGESNIGNFDNAEDFIAILRDRDEAGSQDSSVEPVEDNSPIYLLHSIVYRSEQQNRLTFLGKTVFDSRSTAKLADQYYSVAREIEEVISHLAFSDSEQLGSSEFEHQIPVTSGKAY